ncbi:MAG: hypothetical protein JEY91_05830 [Spirochaetaceae bacterium]|nr:hypothetical protein [Spirochaetaceae bacterium]
MSNPLFEEQIKSGFIYLPMIRLHMAGLTIITFLVFLFYPSQSISYYLARSVKPEMFNIALYTVLAFISYLTVKTTVFSIQNVIVISIKDWFLYTKISVGTYLWGRISYGLFYTTFLILLFLPVILVSASVSAVGPANILAIILMIYLFILILFFLGLLFYTFFRKQHWVLTLLIWVVVILILIISPYIFPLNHPTVLLSRLQVSTDLSSDLMIPLKVSLISITALIFSSWLSIFLYKRSLNVKKG